MSKKQILKCFLAVAFLLIISLSSNAQFEISGGLGLVTGLDSKSSKLEKLTVPLLNVEVKYRFELIRVGAVRRTSLDEQFNSLMIDANLHFKKEIPFYLGIGWGNIQFQDRTPQFPSNSDRIVSDQRLVPRIGLHGKADFELSFYKIQENNFLEASISYVITFKKNN